MSHHTITTVEDKVVIAACRGACDIRERGWRDENNPPVRDVRSIRRRITRKSSLLGEKVPKRYALETLN